MQATFLSRERKPEVNISRARAVVSPSIVYKCVKTNLIGKRLIFCFLSLGGVALYRGKAKGDILVCWREDLLGTTKIV